MARPISCRDAAAQHIGYLCVGSDENEAGDCEETLVQRDISARFAGGAASSHSLRNGAPLGH
jgi:hypothetical protein